VLILQEEFFRSRIASQYRRPDPCRKPQHPGDPLRHPHTLSFSVRELDLILAFAVTILRANSARLQHSQSADLIGSGCSSHSSGVVAIYRRLLTVMRATQCAGLGPAPAGQVQRAPSPVADG
jgi:hypothetical protein